ncbi:gremlin-2-like [Apostichopus japonicus]|uniref:Glycoprotein hormone beta-like 1 n=2 Tax=Stichopus japonicus TaxID=307972 RepID=A0A2Z4C5L2_STIJA|nr:glycoprotein hormone beta-like precursor 1 [Apostichopus japonicus]
MDPVYFSSLIQFVFILPALLSQADSSLDNHPGASREQTVDSSQFPITNPMNALRHGTGPYRSGGGSSLPHELRIEPDKILKPSSEELIDSGTSYLRDDWCKAYTLRQRIEEPGCISRIITNRLCYGQCNSFYIPKQSNDYNQAFQSCSFCKPQKVAYITVTLRCPGQDPPIKTKRVKRIKKCRCMAIDVS